MVLKDLDVHENVLKIEDLFYWTEKNLHILIIIMEFSKKGNLNTYI